MRRFAFSAGAAFGLFGLATFAAEPEDGGVAYPTAADFSGLTPGDIGNYSAVLSIGTDDPQPSKLIGFRNVGKQHVYLFQSSAGIRGYAWVEEGGESLPIPQLPDGSPFENAYGENEIFTDSAISPQDGVVILTAATEAWINSLLTPERLRAAEIENPGEELAAAGGVRALHQSLPDDRQRVWIEADGEAAELPPSPLELDGTGSSWDLLIRPDLAFAPNAQWLFATQKVCTGYAIGYLYRRIAGPGYELATDQRFDALAWRFFAKSEGVSVEELLSSDSPPHLIDFLAFNDRFLVVSLRGAVFELPGEKQVPRNPGNVRGETGIYDWQCVYDLNSGEFVLPPAFAVHNRGAWARWSTDDAGRLWLADARAERQHAVDRLIRGMDADGQARLQEEEKAWNASIEPRRSDPSFVEFDAVRSRAVELVLREIDRKNN